MAHYEYIDIHVQKRSEVPTDGAYRAIFPNGNTEWYLDGKRHRDEEDGPAIVCANGLMVWMHNDKIHRANGPAIVRHGELWIWYQRDKKHRTDGPAYMSAKGYLEYWIDGRHIQSEEYQDKINQFYEEKVLQII